MPARSIEARAAVHAALGDPHRLAMVDALTLSDRSPSDLGRMLELDSNLLAHHLDVLERAGLIARVRSGGDRRRRYLRLLPGAIEGLTSQPVVEPPRFVLFVCTENSARSQLAAAIWNARSDESTTRAESAGTQPASHVHPLAVAAAARHGLDLASAHPRPLNAVEAAPDLIVTVCDRAHEELAGENHADWLHWSVPDPAATGTPAAFNRAFRTLEQRIEAVAPMLMVAA